MPMMAPKPMVKKFHRLSDLTIPVSVFADIQSEPPIVTSIRRGTGDHGP